MVQISVLHQTSDSVQVQVQFGTKNVGSNQGEGGSHGSRRWLMAAVDQELAKLILQAQAIPLPDMVDEFFGGFSPGLKFVDDRGASFSASCKAAHSGSGFN